MSCLIVINTAPLPSRQYFQPQALICLVNVSRTAVLIKSGHTLVHSMLEITARGLKRS